MAMLVVIGLSTTINPDPAQSETCSLPSEHAGMTFPIEKIDPAWVCRLHEIVDNYTTVSQVGPIRAGLPESLYHQLLDRPPLAAALINRLELGLYKSEARGPGRFWGNDRKVTAKGPKGLCNLPTKTAPLGSTILKDLTTTGCSRTSPAKQSYF